MTRRPWRDRELVERLAGAARRELDACVRRLGRVRQLGAQERWDAAIVERLQHLGPRSPAVADWTRATALWWDLALTAETIAGAEARRHAPGLRGTSLSVEDLRSSGLLGAYRAAQTWSPGGGSSWPAYVEYAVISQIRRDLERARTVSSRGQRLRLDLLRALEHLGRDGPATVADAADWLGVDADRAGALVGAVEGGLEDEPSWDPAPEFLEAWDAERLLGLLVHLHPRERAVMGLRIDGRTWPEIGAELGVSVSGARLIWRRGRQRLREMLLPSGGEAGPWTA